MTGTALPRGFCNLRFFEGLGLGNLKFRGWVFEGSGVSKALRVFWLRGSGPRVLRLQGAQAEKLWG